MVNHCQAQRQRASAGTSGICGHGWQMLCAFELQIEGVEDTELKCRLIKVTMENCSNIHFDSPSLGVNATAYYAKIHSFLSLSHTGGGGGRSLVSLSSSVKQSLYHCLYRLHSLSLCGILVSLSSQKELVI